VLQRSCCRRHADARVLQLEHLSTSSQGSSWTRPVPTPTCCLLPIQALTCHHVPCDGAPLQGAEGHQHTNGGCKDADQGGGQETTSTQPVGQAAAVAVCSRARDWQESNTISAEKEHRGVAMVCRCKLCKQSTQQATREALLLHGHVLHGHVLQDTLQCGCSRCTASPEKGPQMRAVTPTANIYRATDAAPMVSVVLKSFTKAWSAGR
jgi:hypothetical protein